MFPLPLSLTEKVSRTSATSGKNESRALQSRDAPIDRPEIGIGRSSHFMTRSVLVHLADLMYRSQFDDVNTWRRIWCVGTYAASQRRCGNAMNHSLWCFEKQWKIRYMSCMFCMMIWWMDCSFLTADSVRADLRITARVSTGAGADRGRSMNIYL